MYSATANRSQLYDDHDELDSEEEEEERRLSAEHGEAGEDNPSRRKRPANSRGNQTTFSEADAAAAKEFEDKVRAKKSRPVLQPAHLKGSKGLVFIRRSFPTQVIKFRAPSAASKVLGAGARSNKYAQKMNQQAQITAAAQYSRSLMSGYRGFASELFPSLAPEDVFLKIEDLGSKKEVKDFLQIMRDELRREYLDKIYGADKAGRILNELEHGLKQHFSPLMDLDDLPPTSNSRAIASNAYDTEPDEVVDSDTAETNNGNEGSENVAPTNPGMVSDDPAFSSEANQLPSEVNDVETSQRKPGTEIEEKQAILTPNDSMDEKEKVEGTDGSDTAPLLKTQETHATSTKSQGDEDGVLESQQDNSHIEKTQETLTFIESEVEDEVEQTKADDADVAVEGGTIDEKETEIEEENVLAVDDRFSQVSVHAPSAVEAQPEGEKNTEDADDRFSQFSVVERQVEVQDNTADDRFSQLSGTGETNTLDGAESLVHTEDNLGSTQLSMEY